MRVYPEPRPVSKEYLEDAKWIDEHIHELMEQYPDQWIAVVDKRVIAASTNLAEVQEIAEAQTPEDREICYDFVERHRHWPFGTVSIPKPS